MAAVLLLTPVLSGILSCQTLKQIVQEPKVSVRSVDPERIGFNGIDMICRLDVENPNGFSIPFPEIEWQLFINSNSFIGGTVKSGGSLAGNGKTSVDVPFGVTYSGLFNTFVSLLDSREAEYRIALGIRFPMTLLNDIKYNLDFSGSIPLLQIPKIHGASFKTARIDLTGIEQDWTFIVENPNNFPVPFPRLDWEYKVNDKPVIKSSLDAEGQIAAMSMSPVTLTAGLKYSDLLLILGSFGNVSELASLMKINSLFPGLSRENSADDFEMPAVIPVFHRPELAFSGIGIKSMGMQRFEFLVTWEIENKNSFPLSLAGFSYNLSVNNTMWAEGVIDAPPAIRPNSKTVIPLDITISSVGIITQIIDIVNRGSTVNVKSEGSYSFSGDIPGLEKTAMPFDLSGITRLGRL